MTNPDIKSEAPDRKNDTPLMGSASPSSSPATGRVQRIPPSSYIITEVIDYNLVPNNPASPSSLAPGRFQQIPPFPSLTEGVDYNQLLNNPKYAWDTTFNHDTKHKSTSITFSTTQADDYLFALLPKLSRNYGENTDASLPLPPRDDDWSDENFYPLPNYKLPPPQKHIDTIMIDSGDVLDEDLESKDMIPDDNHLCTALTDGPLYPCGRYAHRTASDTSIPPLFKVGKLSEDEDDPLLQKLFDAQLPWRTNRDDVHVANDAVASIIETYAYPSLTWKILLLEKSRADKDKGFYTSVIQAVASFVFLLFSQGLLLEIGYRHMFANQIQELWQDLAVQRRKAISVDEFCKTVVRHIRDNPKYCSVSEIDVAEMCTFYSMDYDDYKLNVYDHPCIDSYTVCDPFSDEKMSFRFPSDDKRELYNDIMKVLGEMKSPPTILKADDYARLLMSLLREDADEEELLDNAMKMVDTKALQQHDMTSDLRICVMHIILCTIKNWMREQLRQVVMPLFQSVHTAHHISNEVLEIVQVAEIRRTALGSRFIGRSHFIWAFQECGYRLPSKTRDTVQVHPDEDHPPYHIYIAAANLAGSLGEKITKLEHFVFTVLHSKDIVKEEAKGRLVQRFKDFRKDLVSAMRA